jgi:hypothetical protein
MAGLSDIVEIIVTRNTVLPTREGFGRGLIMAYHTVFPELYRLYSGQGILDDMVTDGFTLRSAAYRMAQAALSQTPRPSELVIGRLPSAHTHTLELTITSAVQGQHIKFKVQRPTDGTVVEVDYTILPAASTTSVAVAVEAIIEAIAGINSAPSAAVITVTPATPGDMLYFYDFENCTIKDVTADAGYDTALTALETATPPEASWYTINIDVASEANIDDVAAWAQARVKAFFPQVIDHASANGTDTIGSGLATLGYTRTVPIWHPHLHEYAACAWVGRCLPQDAGSITWALKTLAGVSAVAITSNQQTNLKAASLNYYIALKGLKLVSGPNGGGTTSEGEFFDIIHGTDWFTEELQTEVLAYLVSQEKVPYTDASGDILEQLAITVGDRGVDRNLFVAGTIAAEAPEVADISDIQKGTREFGDISFSATLAGAIHKATFRATLSL